MPLNIGPGLRITRAETRGVSTNDQLSESVTITIIRLTVMDLIYQFLVGGNFLSFGVPQHKLPVNKTLIMTPTRGQHLLKLFSKSHCLRHQLAERGRDQNKAGMLMRVMLMVMLRCHVMSGAELSSQAR